MFLHFYNISLKDWLFKHRFCAKESIIVKDSDKNFRFIRCLDCQESVYDGEIIEVL